MQTRVQPMAKPPVSLAAYLRRELYFFNLYRLLEAALLMLVLSGSLAGLYGDGPASPLGLPVAAAYLLFAIGMLLWCARQEDVQRPVLLGVGVDILLAAIALVLLPSAAPAIVMMLLFNVAAAAVLLPLRLAMAVALAAAVTLLIHTILMHAGPGADLGILAQRGLFSAAFVAAALLAWLLAQTTRDSHDLAERRGAELANLAELNELIIRRMRTGVLLVDGRSRVQLANEAALTLLDPGGDPGDIDLATTAPELAVRIQRWRDKKAVPDTPLQLGGEGTEVMPRLVPLRAGDDAALVFLDDASQLARRAESISLAAMGRFSASLAHEIRNPLAAIRYAAQLLEESPTLGASDRHLLQIVLQQCQRTDGIVHSVLGMARRERANPERLDLTRELRHFRREHLQVHPDQADVLTLLDMPATGVPAMVDSGHLHQVLTILVNNALSHGVVPGQPPRVRMQAGQGHGQAWIEITDRGPGIPPATVARLFQPFHTTSAHGTGLGLYIARELCRANQGHLEYRALPAGGSCFRISLPAGDTFKIVNP